MTEFHVGPYLVHQTNNELRMSEFEVDDIVMPLEGVEGETPYTQRAHRQPSQIISVGPIQTMIYPSVPRKPFGSFSIIPTASLPSYARLATKDEAIAYFRKRITNELEFRERSDGRLARWNQAIQEHETVKE